MRLNHALLTAALLGAVTTISPAAAQVPAPPPAGVRPVPRRTLPVEEQPKAEKPPVAQPAQEAQPAEAQPAPQEKTDSLPKLPENPIRLEDEKSLVRPDGQPLASSSGAPVAGRRPVKPKGPVYYYGTDPYSVPARVTTPPGMHYPNSPYVEDLSVDGDHGRYVYYSYRRPWYTPGQLSANVTIVW